MEGINFEYIKTHCPKVKDAAKLSKLWHEGNNPKIVKKIIRREK